MGGQGPLPLIQQGLEDTDIPGRLMLKSEACNGLAVSLLNGQIVMSHSRLQAGSPSSVCMHARFKGILVFLIIPKMASRTMG